jgi:beta-glucan synthesis-associated protein KRE6
MTKGGKLSLMLENVAEHGLQYRSGMLQSRNKLCFTSGDIGVSMMLPGPNAETTGYVSRSWFCVCFFALGFCAHGCYVCLCPF